MQAIHTYYLPATNYKPTRIKATCERGSLVASPPDNLEGEAVHIWAAQKLCNNFVKQDNYTHFNPWSLPHVCGGLGNNKGCVHVFVSRNDMAAVKNHKELV